MDYTFDTTNMPTLTSGLIYQIRFRCSNIKGDSIYSEILYASASNPPDQPDPVTVTYSQSSNTSLFVQWDLVDDGTGKGGEITGYKLFSDDGYGGRFKLIYSTVNISPNIDHYLLTGLTKALPYRFKL